jgi:heptosyltransferase II
MSPCERKHYVLLSIDMNKRGPFGNILIIKPGAIGDLLQMTPVIRALSEAYPDARISLLVGNRSSADMFRYNQRLFTSYVYDKEHEHRTPAAFLKFWLELRQKKFDLVVNFQRSNLKTWILAAASFPCRVLVYRKRQAEDVHAVVNYLETLAPLGIAASRLDLEMSTGPEEKLHIKKFIASLGNPDTPLIALNPGASHAVNRWSPEAFAVLADRLAAELRARVIVTGGTGDGALAGVIAAKSKSHPFILAGKFDLLQLAALLEECDLVVSGDTGPMHMAAAVGTRVLALFGAADPARTGPVGAGHRVLQAAGVPCIPCRSRTCKHIPYLACMESLSVETVFAAIQEMLKHPIAKG